MFVDRVEIFVKGGDGGRGMCSFRREKYVPHGGPDGGDGGHGGSVTIRAVNGTDSLAEIANRKFWKAERGEPGGTALKTGKDGKDIVIPVPPGTIIRDRDRGHTLRDLTTDGEEVVVASGGRGGRGNKFFASSTNRTPREYEKGVAGEERWLALELKVIADAGLIGLPNAGKSTLLSRLSQAHPEIADYPFTTKHPNLGVVCIGGDRAFVLADLPGLIEGAHAGIGLGHEFLRHVERTRVLVHLVEPFPTDGSDPLANYRKIRRELELYSAALAVKPEVVAVSKSELTESEEVRTRLAAEVGLDVLGISAVTGQGLSHLVGRVTQLLQEIPAEAIPVSRRVVVDIGNTRIKWGLGENGRIVEFVSLPADDSDAWDTQFRRWALDPATRWTVAAVHPQRRDQVTAWLGARAGRVHVLTSFIDLPLVVGVEVPQSVGMDRLLNAVAANAVRPAGCPAVIVDAGSAVTVDLIDGEGAFRGGAIFPGLRLMSRALHDYTAQLPLVEITDPTQPPGTSTIPAIRTGIYHAVLGGIERLLAIYRHNHAPAPAVYVTGGDAALLMEDRPDLGKRWPAMTLEGILHSEAGADE